MVGLKNWAVVQCSRIECSKYMVTLSATQRKKCPYCGRSFKLANAYVSSYSDQEDARSTVKKFNNRL